MRSVGTMYRAIIATTIIVATLATLAARQESAPRFGGSYSSLDGRRQHLVDDWVARFAEVTGQKVEAAAFYDNVVRLSTKTTFEAITHALMRTTLTDASGNSLG